MKSLEFILDIILQSRQKLLKKIGQKLQIQDFVQIKKSCRDHLEVQDKK